MKMVVKASKADKKITDDAKLCQLLDEYSQILVAAANNVGSNQLQNIRKGLRGDSVVLMGKNTMMKRSIRMHAEKTSNNIFLNLIPLLQGNVGLIFTKGDVKEVSEEVSKYKDPSKFAVAAGPVYAGGDAAPAAASKEEEKKDEPAEESDDDMGFSLFD